MAPSVPHKMSGSSKTLGAAMVTFSKMIPCKSPGPRLLPSLSYGLSAEIKQCTNEVSLCDRYV